MIKRFSLMNSFKTIKNLSIVIFGCFLLLFLRFLQKRPFPIAFFNDNYYCQSKNNMLLNSFMNAKDNC